MKLFAHPASTCSRKCLTVLHEKNAEFEFVLVDLAKGEHKQPAHLARQPFGVVPAFQDGAIELYESRAIIRYLDEKLPGTKLTPATMEDRARMEQWISVEYSYTSGPIMKVFMQRVYGPMFGKPTDEAVVQEGLAGTARAFDVLEKHLAGKKYLVGEQFSLADVTYMPYLEYLAAAGAGNLITERPALAAWWKGISDRPSWAKASGKA